MLVCEEIGSPKGAFLMAKMKITKLYIDRAVYKAGDELGRELWLEIDYWNNSFRVSDRNKKLENVAKDLLKRKHKVNFASKLLK